LKDYTKIKSAKQYDVLFNFFHTPKQLFCKFRKYVLNPYNPSPLQFPNSPIAGLSHKT